MIGGLELSVPPQPLGKGEGLRVVSVANGQWFNQSCLRDDASMRKQQRGFEELLSW